MPKNKGKGGKKHRRGAAKNKTMETSKKVIFKENGQEYAKIEKVLGDGRFECVCSDDKTRIGIVRGSMRRRVWLSLGNIVLVSLRDFQDKKCDIIDKYDDSQISRLRSLGEIDDFNGKDQMDNIFYSDDITDTTDVNIDDV